MLWCKGIATFERFTKVHMCHRLQLCFALRSWLACQQKLYVAQQMLSRALAKSP